MNDNEKAIETLCQAIVQTVKMNSNDTDIIATVTSVSGNNITVSVNGNSYTVKNGIGVTFTVGDRCLIHLINGNFNNKVIIAKL